MSFLSHVLAFSSVARMSAIHMSKRMRVVEESPFLTQINNTLVVSTIEEVPSGAKKIGTHDGKFHCDEALACAFLKCLPEWSEATIVRTRNPEQLAQCDIIVDVGGKYDASALLFDHHQKGFTEVLDQYETKLSSAGLIYKHFGREVIASVIQGTKTELPSHISEVIFQKIYKSFVESIDGIDNGVSVSESPLKYRITTDLSARVGRLHPSWNEDASNLVVNACFREAVLLTGSEFLQQVYGLTQSWWPARSVVEEAMNKSTEVDASGRIMVLESGGVPWQSHVFDIEAERNTEGGAGSSNKLLFVLYTDNGGKWRVQAVPEEEGSFASRLKLHESWRGLRDDALSTECGFPGAVFVHAGGFIGGHSTYEGALGMAQKTISLAGL